ncbi:hypothetical protein AB6735_25590 [Mucilaginibacter sp. RCC_168]|uniref:hypothetical protein n=1 Tax=Mucilaginibacter sp. RCC_168 TaxID=3239221 RepID=UPI0035251C20
MRINDNYRGELRQMDVIRHSLALTYCLFNSQIIAIVTTMVINPMSLTHPSAALGI